MPASQHDSMVASLLSRGSYRNADRCKPDILSALHHYSGLKPKLEKFTFNDGRNRDLICLNGTIPVPYRNNMYNIPVDIWILDTHPTHAPVCYVRPTPDMSIKVSAHVDGNGKIYLPYLHEWDPSNSDILGLIQMCIITFGEQPPVFAKPQGAVQPPPMQPQAYPPPYPPTNSGYGGYPAYPPSTGGAAYPPPYPPVSSNVGGYPPAYPPPVQTNTNANTSTITQEHILMSMRQAVEDKVRQKLREEYGIKQAELQSLNSVKDELNKGQIQLRQAIEVCDREHDAMERSIQELKKEEKQMKETLESAEKIADDSKMKPEDAVTVSAPLFRQLIEAHAEEAAVDEAIYYLGQALKHEVIDCDVFLKSVRKMARKQFKLRATMNKCREVAGLPV